MMMDIIEDCTEEKLDAILARERVLRQAFCLTQRAMEQLCDDRRPTRPVMDRMPRTVPQEHRGIPIVVAR